MKTFVMTTGSKGLHVVVPIKPIHTFEEIRTFAKEVGKIMVEEEPSLYTLNPRKSGRKSKLFIDYLRNGYAQTAVAPYAVRALDGAPVAMPISWAEVNARLSPQKYTLKTVRRGHTKSDPWKGMERSAKKLPAKLKRS